MGVRGRCIDAVHYPFFVKASSFANGLIESLEVPITADNFVRAATDLELEKYVKLAGGTNAFFHFRAPTPVENQPTIRMNRDTLYSTTVVDISQGAKLTLPDVGDRYMTAMVVNQDHYINEVFSGGGSYSLDMDTFDTPFVIVYVRTLIKSGDGEEGGGRAIEQVATGQYL